jgi:drug/metabolite transporter (DMT)-like permease
MSGGDPYSGLFGAYRYAFRRSDSRLFRAYVAGSAFVGAFVSLLLVLAVISWAGEARQFGEKALLSVIGVLILGPLFAPVLIVARRYRLGRHSPGSDRLFALAGTVFVVSIWLALFVSAPNSPADVPRLYGLAPPVVAALGIYLVVRHTRVEHDVPTEGTETA